MKIWQRSAYAAVFAVGFASIAAYGAAQPKGDAGQGGRPRTEASAEQAEMHCEHDKGGCPAKEIARLSEVKLEKTSSGAVLTVIAREPSKVAELQSLLERLAQHLKSGECHHAKDGAHPMGRGRHPSK